MNSGQTIKRKTFISALSAIVLLIAAFLTFKMYGALGCLAGGGGSNHTPPTSFEAGKPIALNVEYTRWAAPECLTGQVTDDYSEVRCHYRIQGQQDFHAVDMTVVSAEKDRAVYQCIIPYPAARPATIEYYFDAKMNGVYNRRDEKPLIVN